MFVFSPLTLFPEMFPGTLSYSLAGKALKEGKWSVNPINLRDFGKAKHCNVDDSPYGGGAGMVMRPDVVHDALTHSKTVFPHNHAVYLTPRGAPLTQNHIKRFITYPGLTFLCGRFEGVDERVTETWDLEEISLGDYILSGGELGALIIMDACVRLLDNVMGNRESEIQESFSLALLEYPQYTRPHNWNNKIVPDVLLSGDHQKIAAWRQLQAEMITQMKRPDLWERYQQSKKDR